MNNLPHQDKVALITGASEGIGLELAKIMAGEGWNLILVARREALLNQLGQELESRHGVQTRIIPLDLSQPNSADQLFERVKETGLVVEALINNAGFGLVGPFKDSASTRVSEMLTLNMITLTRLTHLFIPGMLNKGRGWIMNVGSVAGFMPLPYFNAYAASKAYVNSFSQALASELDGTGITVTCLTPGPTHSGFGRVAGYKRHQRSELGAMTAASVARLGYDSLMQGKRLVVTGGTNRLIVFLNRFLPREILVDLAGQVMKKRQS